MGINQNSNKNSKESTFNWDEHFKTFGLSDYKNKRTKGHCGVHNKGPKQKTIKKLKHDSPITLWDHIEASIIL